MAFQLDRMARKPDHRGEHDEQQAEPVDADVVRRADARDPGRLFLELPCSWCRIEVKDQREGDQESGQRNEIGAQLDGPLICSRDEKQNKEARQRREEHDRENVIHIALK